MPTNNDVAAIPASENWQSVTFQNSWIEFDSTTYGTSGYYKDPLGIVHLKGLVKSGTVGSNTPIFTLPSGYRPSERQILIAIGGQTTFARIDIFTTGAVAVVGASTLNTGVSLFGLTFRV